MVEPILVLDGLVKDYKHNRGVGPLSLRLPPGIHALVGPNGAGKTTLIQTLLGFHIPTGGTGKLLGVSIGSDPIAIRRRIGYMAEHDVVVPMLNAVKTVRLAAELSGMSRAEAIEAAANAIEMVGLGDVQYVQQKALSTGQRQQVKLASAIVHKPEFLILDEPTNGLDPVSRARMLNLIRRLHEENGSSVLLCTHVLPDVESVCETAVVIRDGRIVGHEDAKKVVTEANSMQVRVTAGRDQFMAAAAKKKWSPTLDGEMIHLQTGDVDKIFALAKATGARIEDLRTIGTSIQDRAVRRMTE